MQIVKRSATTLFLAVLSFAAAAHPHSFITLKTQIMVKDNQLTFTMPETQSRGMKSGKSWRQR